MKKSEYYIVPNGVPLSPDVFDVGIMQDFPASEEYPEYPKGRTVCICACLIEHAQVICNALNAFYGKGERK